MRCSTNSRRRSCTSESRSQSSCPGAARSRSLIDSSRSPITAPSGNGETHHEEELLGSDRVGLLLGGSKVLLLSNVGHEGDHVVALRRLGVSSLGIRSRATGVGWGRTSSISHARMHDVSARATAVSFGPTSRSASGGVEAARGLTESAGVGEKNAALGSRSDHDVVRVSASCVGAVESKSNVERNRKASAVLFALSDQWSAVGEGELGPWRARCLAMARDRVGL